MRRIVIVTAAWALLAATPAQAAESRQGWGDALSTAVKDGEVSLEFRYRFELVDQAGFSEDAEASTLRSRLTLQSGPVGNFTGLLETDHVATVAIDDYNSTANGRTRFPVVADPEGTDLNRFWLRYSAKGFTGTAGRQTIRHGNERFAGAVSWRQNQQTFDALRLQFQRWERLRLDASYVRRVNRIFGPDDGVNPKELEGDNFFLRGDFRLSDNHSFRGFGYWLDFDPQRGYGAGKTVNNSSDTWGVEYSGQFGRFNLDAAWATQSAAGRSELRYDASYHRAVIKADLDPVTLRLARETLGAGDGTGFATPLATLHGFQGWTDKFLATPGDGVEDTWASVSGALGKVKLTLVHHNFQAEASSADLGAETGFLAVWPVSRQFKVSFKYASFSSDDKSRFTDADKLWLTLQLNL